MCYQGHTFITRSAVGLLFDGEGEHVLLRRYPDDVYDGIISAVNVTQHEEPLAALRREFAFLTSGLEAPTWTHFAVYRSIRGDFPLVAHWFYAFHTARFNAALGSPAQLTPWCSQHLPDGCVEDLGFMVPVARAHAFGNTRFTHVVLTEKY